MHVAQAAAAALGHQQAVVVLGQVADDFIGGDVDDHGADRHGDGQVFTALAIGLAAHAVLAALRLEDAVMAEVDQGVQVFVGADVHAAARTAVAAVRAAERNELLATEANASVAAVAGEHFDFCFVYQFHCFDACDGRGICAVALNVMRARVARSPARPVFLLPGNSNEKPRRSGALHAACASSSTAMPRHGCRRCLDQASAETMLPVRRFLEPLT
ncbi:hypothetical protein G6F61_013821 [Rhizopus arrhizus]|nr:hypothetical protein G6F61_013821 [Rhizopus arrhizus]